MVVTHWYNDSIGNGLCLRLHDVPNTLSGDILRLRRNAPEIELSIEINGNMIRSIPTAPLPERPDDPDDDVNEALEDLPIVLIDPRKHFLKRVRYNSEVQNLLKCQGGSCPGKPLSPHIIQLHGKSPTGKLVFEKFWRYDQILPYYCSVALYKRWTLELIAALKCLHSLGIVHRDVKIENVLWTHQGDHIILCDLEEHWGCRDPPEICYKYTTKAEDAGWTMKSDIYDIGCFIKGLIYSDLPPTSQIQKEWVVPPPFDVIVEACSRPKPEDRPTLDEVAAMVEAVLE